MKIYIITEGSKTGGLGHLERCKALYEAFEEKGLIPEFIVNGDKTAGEVLKDKKHIIFDWLKEKVRLFNTIKGSDISIIDSYIANNKFYEEVSVLTRIPVYIDDNKRIDYPKGIIVNGSIHGEETDFTRKGNNLCLLGTKYIPLRREFREVPEKKIKENLESVMITFGGSDVRNMTPRVLKMLNEGFADLTKKVVIGRGFQNVKEIEELKEAKTEMIYSPDAEGMKRVMLESDLAISAAGHTLYELAMFGVPTMAVAVADNQLNSLKGWQKSGFIEYAGWWEDKETMNILGISLKRLENKDLRGKMTEAGKTLVDGNGAKRVAEEIMKMFG